jgi:hypothetical protein
MKNLFPESGTIGLCITLCFFFYTAPLSAVKPPETGEPSDIDIKKIGRASCRERVSSPV